MKRDRQRFLASASWPAPDRPRGVTVVELIVVMAIVASLMGVGLSLAGVLSRDQLRQEVTRLASALKFAHNNAALNNAQYRMVIDLEAGSYHIEVTDEPLVVAKDDSEASGSLTDEARALQDAMEKKESLFDEGEDPFDINRKVTFERVQDGVLKDTKLDDGLRFKAIYTASREEPYTEGVTSVSFFPNGFQEPVFILLQNDDGATMSLLTDALTGRVKIYDGRDEPPEDFGKVESDD
jgi:general secretion pathway protein H